MIGIDTYSWTKLYLLIEESWKEIINEWIEALNFFITPAVEKELLHFHGNKAPIWKQGAILPVLDIKTQDYISNGFDKADASLLEYADIKNYKIVTEDGPMLSFNVTHKQNIIQLVDLIKSSYTENFFTQNEFHRLIKWFRKKRNITKRKVKSLRTRYLSK